MNNRERSESGALIVWTVLAVTLVLAGLFYLIRQRPSVPEGESVKELYLPDTPLYSERMERIPVQIFFPARDLRLKAENREIYRSGEEVNHMRQIVILLLQGPLSEDLFPLFPKGFKLRELYFYDGGVYVDLKVQGVEAGKTGCLMEYLAVTSIRDSMMKNFPEIAKVKIVMNGREAETLSGHIDIRQPLQINNGGTIESSHRDL
jgi:hypothetical protein